MPWEQLNLTPVSTSLSNEVLVNTAVTGLSALLELALDQPVLAGVAGLSALALWGRLVLHLLERRAPAPRLFVPPAVWPGQPLPLKWEIASGWKIQIGLVVNAIHGSEVQTVFQQRILKSRESRGQVDVPLPVQSPTSLHSQWLLHLATISPHRLILGWQAELTVHAAALSRAAPASDVSFESSTMAGPADSLGAVEGEKMGPYRIGRFLGRGAMAAVYESIGPGGRVAIKVMAGQKDNLRFLKEILISRKLEHPGIVRVLDSNIHKGRIYLVMEYVEGQPLNRVWLQPMPLNHFLSLFIHLAQALDYAHHQGIVHRDVKPANILIRSDGRPVIVDFGIARADDVADVTRSGDIVGTPLYISPEQLQAQPASPLSDQYSLGMVGYQLLTAALPFDADGTMILMAQRLMVEPVDVREFRHDLPDAVAAVIMRMLERQPNRRFPDLDQVVRQLYDLL